jgi:hypothetical protein
MALGYPLYVNGRELQQPFVLVHAAPGTYQAVAQPGIDGLGKIKIGGKIKLGGKKVKIGKWAAAVLTGGASVAASGAAKKVKKPGKVAAAILTGGASVAVEKTAKAKKGGKWAAAILTGGASVAAKPVIKATKKIKPKTAATIVGMMVDPGTTLAVLATEAGVKAAKKGKIEVKVGGKAKVTGKGRTTSTPTTTQAPTTSTAAWMNKIKSTGKTKGLTTTNSAAWMNKIKSTGKTKPAEAIIEEAAVLPEEPVVGFGTKLGIGLLGLLLVGGGAYLLLRKKSPSPSALGARSSAGPRRSVRSTRSSRRPLRTNRRR